MIEKLKLEFNDEQIAMICFSLGCYLGSIRKESDQDWAQRSHQVVHAILVAINEAREKRKTL